MKSQNATEMAAEKETRDLVCGSDDEMLRTVGFDAVRQLPQHHHARCRLINGLVTMATTSHHRQQQQQQADDVTPTV